MTSMLVCMRTRMSMWPPVLPVEQADLLEELITKYSAARAKAEAEAQRIRKGQTKGKSVDWSRLHSNHAI